MPEQDPILAEIRAHRESHAKAFNFDIRAIVEDLKKQQQQSGEKLMMLSVGCSHPSTQSTTPR